MRRLKVFLLILVMCFSLIQFAGSLAQDAQNSSSLYPCSGELKKTSANIRQQPSEKSKKVGSANKKSSVTVLSEATDNKGNKWYEVELDNGVSGYVSGKLLSVHTNVSIDAPVQTETPTASTAELTLPSTVSDTYLEKGKNLKLSLPADLETNSKKIIWSTTDKSVATVNRGTVKAIHTGDCIITAALKDRPEVSTQWHIIVTQKVKKLVIDRKKISLDMFKSASVEYKVSPADASNTTLTWDSSDPSIAIVDSNGNITGITGGDCTITCTTTDGSDIASSVSVHVNTVMVLETWNGNPIGDTIQTEFCTITVEEFKVLDRLQYSSKGNMSFQSSSSDKEYPCLIGSLTNTSNVSYIVDIGGNFVIDGNRYNVSSWTPRADTVEPGASVPLYIYSEIPKGASNDYQSCYLQFGFNRNFTYDKMSYNDSDNRYVYRNKKSNNDDLNKIYTPGNTERPHSSDVTIYGEGNQTLGNDLQLGFAQFSFTDFGVVDRMNHRYSANYRSLALAEEPGYKYVYLRAYMKNLSNQELTPKVTGVMKLDDYSYNLGTSNVRVSLPSREWELVGSNPVPPLDTSIVYIYVLVPDEIADTFSSCQISFQILDADDNATEPLYTFTF